MATTSQSPKQDLTRQIDEQLKELHPRSLKGIARRLCEQLDSVPDILFEDAKKSIFAAISEDRADHGLHLLQLDSNLNWVWYIFQHADDTGQSQDPEMMDRTMGSIREFLDDYDEQSLFSPLIKKEQWKHERGSQSARRLNTHSNDILKAAQQAPAMMRLGVLEALCEKAATQDTGTLKGIQRQLPRAWAIAERWVAVIKAFPALGLVYDWEYLLEFIRRNEWDHMDTWAKEVQALETIVQCRAQVAPAQGKTRLNERAESITQIVRDFNLPYTVVVNYTQLQCLSLYPDWSVLRVPVVRSACLLVYRPSKSLSYDYSEFIFIESD